MVIPSVYSFNILDYNAPEFKGQTDYFHKVQLKDESNRIFSDNITYYFVGLCKFATVKDKSEKVAPIIRWLELLTTIGNSTDQNYGAEDQGVGQGLNEGKRQLVLNMLTEGFDLETIARISGFNRQEIIGMRQQ